MTLALNLAKSLRDRNGLEPLITKADIAPQDMAFQDEKLKRLKKMMKKHPGKNTNWDPEIATKQFAETSGIRLDAKISRQVRRQVERILDKKDKRRKFGKKFLDYDKRVQRVEDPKTHLVTHQIVPIKRVTLTQIDTSRYKPHQGKNIRYASNGQRFAV